MPKKVQQQIQSFFVSGFNFVLHLRTQSLVIIIQTHSPHINASLLQQSPIRRYFTCERGISLTFHSASRFGSRKSPAFVFVQSFRERPSINGVLLRSVFHSTFAAASKHLRPRESKGGRLKREERENINCAAYASHSIILSF